MKEEKTHTAILIKNKNYKLIILNSFLTVS